MANRVKFDTSDKIGKEDLAVGLSVIRELEDIVDKADPLLSPVNFSSSACNPKSSVSDDLVQVDFFLFGYLLPRMLEVTNPQNRPV